jgi:hypothetical protein
MTATQRQIDLHNKIKTVSLKYRNLSEQLLSHPDTREKGAELRRHAKRLTRRADRVLGMSNKPM